MGFGWVSSYISWQFVPPPFWTLHVRAWKIALSGYSRNGTMPGFGIPAPSEDQKSKVFGIRGPENVAGSFSVRLWQAFPRATWRAWLLQDTWAKDAKNHLRSALRRQGWGPARRQRPQTPRLNSLHAGSPCQLEGSSPLGKISWSPWRHSGVLMFYKSKTAENYTFYTYIPRECIYDF